jgi:intracellular sulfur oxidation DsrE/DsrF family protein
MKQYRVIFHVSEENIDKVTFALNNILNLLNDLGSENIDIELLVNGPAVKAFKSEGNEISELIRQVLEKPVDLALCNNAMKKFNLSLEDMLNEARVVPSGVGELVRKQAEGWAYIRP